VFDVWPKKTRRLRHVGQLLGDPMGSDETLIKSPRKGQVMAATRKADQQHPRAALTFDEIAKSYIIADDQIYPVASCPSAIFKMVVLNQAPQWKDSPTYGPMLASATHDTVTRWWILCSLCEAGRPMKLYASREEAERALGDQVQLDRSTAAR
jgi:hypothetical protein